MQEWYRSRALYETVLKLLKARKFGDALELADRIPDKKIRSMALNQIIIEMVKSGEDYSRVIEKAVEGAMEIPKKEESIKALMRLAFDLLEIGKIDDAVKIASYIPDVSNKSKVEAEIAIKLAERGDIQRAMEILDNLLDEDVKTWAMSRLANKL